MVVCYDMCLCFRDASLKGGDDSASKLLSAPVKISEDARNLGQYNMTIETVMNLCYTLMLTLLTNIQ